MVGISLKAFDFMLQIRYVDDVRFTWYTFGGMVSWISLALVVGVISAMAIFQLQIHVNTFGKGFFVWHYSWYKIL